MIDELNTAIKKYQSSWHTLVRGRKSKDFFESLKPTAAGWKVNDLDNFDRCFAQLRQHATLAHLVWLNERWIADFGLRKPLVNGVRIVKLMQRRPDSGDAAGLDHVDFLSPAPDAVSNMLANEPDLKWTEEYNGQHCKWVSIWFDGGEAKLRPDLALDASIGDIEDFKQLIMQTADD